MDEVENPDGKKDIVGYVAHHRKRFGRSVRGTTHNLTNGDPKGVPFSEAVESAMGALNDHFYMPSYDSYGATAVNSYGGFLKELGIDRKFNNSNFVPTIGGTHAYVLALETLLDKNDVLLVPVPTYGYFLDPRLTGHTNVVPIHLREEDGYKLTPEYLDKEIARINKDLEKEGKRVTAFLNINPHNPTGVVYTRDEIEPLADVIKKHNLRIVIDDIAYTGLEYGYDKESFKPRFAAPMAAIEGMFERTVTLLSLSKNFNMVGARAGLVVGPSNFVNKIRSKINERCEYTPIVSEMALQGTFNPNNKESRDTYLARNADKHGFRYHLLRAIINGWDNDAESRKYFETKGIFSPDALAQSIYPNESFTGNDGKPNKETVSDFIVWSMMNRHLSANGLSPSDLLYIIKDCADKGETVEEDDKSPTPEKMETIRELHKDYLAQKEASTRRDQLELIKMLNQGMPELRALPISEAGFFLMVDATALKGKRVWAETLNDAGDVVKAISKRGKVAIIPGEAMGIHDGKLILRITFSDRAVGMIAAMKGVNKFLEKVDLVPGDELQRIMDDMKRGGPELLSATERLLSETFGPGKERGV